MQIQDQTVLKKIQQRDNHQKYLILQRQMVLEPFMFNFHLKNWHSLTSVRCRVLIKILKKVSSCQKIQIKWQKGSLELIQQNNKTKL